MLVYDIDLESSNNWEIPPQCPVCDEDVLRSHVERNIIQEVTDDYIETKEGEKPWDRIDPDTWNTREERVSVVEPCGHKFLDESKMYYYLLSHRWLKEELLQMRNHNIPIDPILKAIERQKDGVRESRLH